jgi:hypothetical protein|tara:strand:+ start:479 stop:688 length:210 start_codon:yes stop_codon:yes gene_type:complete
MIVKVDNTKYDVFLLDDGSLDTVIEIDGIEHRFDSEYASFYRAKMGEMTIDGLEMLAKECIDEDDRHWK